MVPSSETSNRIVWSQESGAERSVEKSWFRWSCRVQSAKDFSTNTGDLPYNQAASQQSDRHSWPLYAQSALLCTFLHTPSLLKLLWLEWFRMTPIQNSTTVAGVKPLETTCSSGTLTSTLTFFMFIFHHFCQFWLWLRDYIHCKRPSNFATRPWKLGYLTIKSFFHKSSSSGLAVPPSFDYILSLGCRSFCDPNGTCWDTCIQL